MEDPFESMDKQAQDELLARYDRVYRRVNDTFNVIGSQLSYFITDALQHRGIVRPEIRAKFVNSGPPEMFDFLEKSAKAEFPDG